MPRFSPSARRALTQHRKEQILKAAAQVFAARGFERATIADIARTAGIAEGSIYNYFKNKGDLLVSIPAQIVELPVEGVSASMKITDQATLSPEQVLSGAAETVIGAIRQNAVVFRVLLAALPSLKPAAREKYLNQVILYATGVLEGYVRRQMEQGVFRRNLNPRIVTRVFIGMFFPFVMIRELLQIEEGDAWDYDQVIAEAIPVFMRGVLAKPAERKTQ